jgi:(S)-ureidoglycine aminohydrolase
MTKTALSPIGQTRTHVTADHALIAPDSHVAAPLDGWSGTEGVVLISPAMGAGPRAPRFSQYLVQLDRQTRMQPRAAGLQRLIYVLDGAVTLDGERLERDAFAWLPPDMESELRAPEPGTLLVFDKPYVRLSGVVTPRKISGTLATTEVEPFLGDADAVLATLLPVDPGFDMAVNVFTYQPGATLPFVETHVMEHGLFMRSGQGVYRLADHWYPVQKGDAIWMASYCPQWFVAMGKQPASYIYYKDVHRSPFDV